jgi:DNA-binding XRE family transcriptional regulator
MATRAWKDVREGLVSGVGEDTLARARAANQAYIDAHRLAERRTALGLTQADVADRMGVTKGRISQIERGEVSTVDVIARYVAALGGVLQVSAVFGDDQLLLRSASGSAA